MPTASRWASSPGRTILVGVVAILVAAIVGTGLYAVSLSMVFGAVFITAGASHADAAGLVLGSTSIVALALEVIGVALAGAVTCVLATRSATVSPRWWPPLFAGLAAGAAYWAMTIGSASGDDLLALYLWPTHLSSWISLVAAQLVVVNLGARRT
jgi:hypothetical protein